MKNEKSILEINKFKLDEEWVSQPRLMKELCEELAEAKQSVREQDAEHDKMIANLDFKIRTQPEKYGLEKVTEASIKNAIVLSEDFQESLKLLNKAKKLEDLANGNVRACDHRKAALEGLVYLHGAGFFAAPRAPENSKEKMEKAKRDAAFTRKKEK